MGNRKALLRFEEARSSVDSLVVYAAKFVSTFRKAHSLKRVASQIFRS